MLKLFYELLDEKNRFSYRAVVSKIELQAIKKVRNFPFLWDKAWIDSEK